MSSKEGSRNAGRVCFLELLDGFENLNLLWNLESIAALDLYCRRPCFRGDVQSPLRNSDKLWLACLTRFVYGLDDSTTLLQNIQVGRSFLTELKFFFPRALKNQMSMRVNEARKHDLPVSRQLPSCRILLFKKSRRSDIDNSSTFDRNPTLVDYAKIVGIRSVEGDRLV